MLPKQMHQLLVQFERDASKSQCHFSVRGSGGLAEYGVGGGLLTKTGRPSSTFKMTDKRQQELASGPRHSSQRGILGGGDTTAQSAKGSPLSNAISSTRSEHQGQGSREGLELSNGADATFARASGGKRDAVRSSSGEALEFSLSAGQNHGQAQAHEDRHPKGTYLRDVASPSRQLDRTSSEKSVKRDVSATSNSLAGEAGGWAVSPRPSAMSSASSASSGGARSPSNFPPDVRVEEGGFVSFWRWDEQGEGDSTSDKSRTMMTRR